MPIFEYQCKDCQHKFEHIQKNSQDKAECPKCHSESLQKLISPPTILPMGGAPPSGSAFS